MEDFASIVLFIIVVFAGMGGGIMLEKDVNEGIMKEFCDREFAEVTLAELPEECKF